MRRKRVIAEEESAVTALSASLRDNLIKEYGKAAIPDTEALFDSVYGLKLENNLPLQFLLGVDVLALSRWLHIVGPTGSCKSSLGIYLAKLFLEAGGVVVFLDAEHKTSPDQIREIVRNDDLIRSGWITVNIDDLNQAMMAISSVTKNYIKQCKGKQPLMFFFDSIGAVTGEEAGERLDKTDKAYEEGFAPARLANQFTQQMQTYYPIYVAKYPIVFLSINHQKISLEQPKTSFGPVKKTTPGGAHKDFMATWTIELNRGETVFKKAAGPEQPIYIKTIKNSLGWTGMKFQVDLIGRTDSATGESYKEFNWNRSLTNMLASDQFSSEAVAEVLGLVKNGNKCNSSVLGLKEVSPEEMGAAIHANPTVMQAVQGLMRIKSKRAFDERAG
jgi:RecA/RadA recombinase